MVERKVDYFVADVHLGLKSGDPKEREERFLSFLKGIPRDTTRSLYLLGDIWDFWYEYRDVVPREGARVTAQLIDLMDAGVKVFFIEGNHDMWTYSFFESLGIVKLAQPCFLTIDGKDYCLGHGDCLVKEKFSVRLMNAVFHSKVARALFSTVHPRLAFGLGNGWSDSNRRSHKPYKFRGAEEKICKYAEKVSSERHVDCFVFGHFHVAVDMRLNSGARFVILKDWIDGGQPYARLEDGVISF